METEPRMDGTPLQQAHWRIKALREMLQHIYLTAPEAGVASVSKLAHHALLVDDQNAATEKS